MRQFFLIYFFLLATLLTVLGFRGCKFDQPPMEIFPDMDRQMKFHEQSETTLFADGRTDRPHVDGTVPFVTEKQAEYAHLSPNHRFREDDYLVTGYLPTDPETFGDGLPVDISEVNMLRGQELYNIFCSVCHGETGNGMGVIAHERYGYGTIVSLLQQRIIDQPDGEIYNTIVWGRNTMMPYGKKLRVEDRWKVVMYVRALQRAATATIDDVPPENRGDLNL